MRIHYRLSHKENWAAFFFLLPSATGFAVFYLIPFIQSIFTSLSKETESNQFTLHQYKEVMHSLSFQKGAVNTLYFTAISVPLLVVLSLALALMLNQRVFFRNWLRTSMVLPLVVPVASIVLVWQMIFDWNGVLNHGLELSGHKRIDWYNSSWAGMAIMSSYLWKYTGYNVILFLAGLQNIPESYYELAELEGAGPVQRLFGITLVYLTPTMFLVILMSILNSFKIFRETYLIAGPYPHESIYMLQHYMNNMFLSLDIYKLSAAAVLMAAGIFVLVVLFFQIEKRFRAFME